jgi:hypothetical protein
MNQNSFQIGNYYQRLHDAGTPTLHLWKLTDFYDLLLYDVLLNTHNAGDFSRIKLVDSVFANLNRAYDNASIFEYSDDVRTWYYQLSRNKLMFKMELDSQYWEVWLVSPYHMNKIAKIQFLDELQNLLRVLNNEELVYEPR